MIGQPPQRERADSKNPFLRRIDKDAASGPLDANLDGSYAVPMTTSGTVTKTAILTLLLLVTAGYAFVNPSPLFLWGGMLGGLGLAMFTAWKPRHASWSAPAYALLEGLFVGAASAMYAYLEGGIILQAVSLTIGVLLVMLLLYQTGTIKVTARLRSTVMAATGAIMLVYLVSIGLSFFGMSVPFLHENSPMGIGISLLIIGVAAFNLLLDFDNIERGVAAQLPARYEWVFSMGLLITLVWLYIEILRLLAISRD